MSGKRVIVVSAHEGATTWVSLCRFIGTTTDYQISSFHQYDDDAYRGARSGMQRLALRLHTFLLFPLRFLLHARGIARSSDLVVVVTSPFYMPILAAWALGRSRARLIALLNDIYPEALVAKGLIRRDGAIDRFIKRRFARALGRMQAVVFITDYHKAFVSRDMRLPPQAPVIPVSAHSDPFEGCTPALSSGPVQVTYCGTLGLMHDTATFLSWLEGERPQGNVHFSFYTSGAAKVRFEAALRRQLTNRGLQHQVELSNALQEADWVRVMKEAHVGLVFQDVGSGKVIFPSKLASILAAGQAVLAVAEHDSDLGRLVRDNDCGWVVAPRDSAAFGRAIGDASDPQLLLAKRMNAFRVGQALFGKRAVARRWVELFDGTPHGTCGVPTKP